MRRFQFRLQSVFKLRMREEERCQREFGAAVNLRDQVLCQVASRRQQIEATVGSYHESICRKFDLRMVNDYHDYLDWLNQMLKSETVRLRRCEAQVVEARRLLMEAVRAKKMVEKLKEKAYRHYQAAELQTEINFLDEIGINRFVRRETTG